MLSERPWRPRRCCKVSASAGPVTGGGLLIEGTRLQTNGVGALAGLRSSMRFDSSRSCERLFVAHLLTHHREVRHGGGERVVDLVRQHHSQPVDGAAALLTRDEATARLSTQGVAHHEAQRVVVPRAWQEVIGSARGEAQAIDDRGLGDEHGRDASETGVTAGILAERAARHAGLLGNGDDDVDGRLTGQQLERSRRARHLERVGLQRSQRCKDALALDRVICDHEGRRPGALWRAGLGYFASACGFAGSRLGLRHNRGGIEWFLSPARRAAMACWRVPESTRRKMLGISRAPGKPRR